MNSPIANLRLQDALGARLCPAILDYLQEPFEERPMLDKLNRLEKLGYIQNKFTHDYPDDPDKNAAFINLAIETAQDLVGALADIEKKLRQERPALILVGKVPLRN